MDWGDFLGQLGSQALDFTGALGQAGAASAISDITGQQYYPANVYGTGTSQVVNRNNSMMMIVLIVVAVLLLRK